MSEGSRLRSALLVVQRLVERPIVVLFLLGFLTTLIYSNTFSSPFQFDDDANIVNNDHIRHIPGIAEMSGSRYVGFLSFAVNYHLGRLQVWGYHVVNLLIHIANGFLVYTLVPLLIRTPVLRASLSPLHPRGVAFATALLFVAHPIQTQAVTYVVQRFASLATLFYLLALICYVQWRAAEPGHRARYGWYAGALGATILAMKTKEISFTLPVMLLLVEGVFFRPKTWRQWLPLIPFLITMVIIPLSLPGGLGETEARFARQNTEITRLSYLFTQFRVIVTYLRLLIFPVHQNLDYDYPISHVLLEPSVVWSFLALLGLLGLAIYLFCVHPHYRVIGFGLLWFFLTLSVESSLIPIPDVIFEHRLYLPSVGMFLAASALGARLFGGRGRAAVVAVGLIVLVCAVATYQRNRVWKDEVTLWSNAVAGSPNKARPHNNLGMAYAQQGRREEAITEIMTAVHLDPGYSDARNNLGNAYLQQGRLDEAIAELTVAVRLTPDFANAHFNLGHAYARQGRVDQAIAEFLIGLRLTPDFPEAHSNLGDIYAEQGRSDDAINEYKAASQLDPRYPEAHINLGNVYAQQGRLDEAIQEFSTGAHLKPDSPEAHYNLGSAYARQGQFDAAIEEYQTAIRLRENFPEAYYNLGNVYKFKGLRDEARKQFEIAVHFRPDFAPAQQALQPEP